MRRITALLISLWLGFHLSVGCVVAPLVSNHLNTSDSGKALADTLSGSLFHIANLFTLAVWLIVYFTARSDNRMAYHKSRTPFWAGTLLVFTAINEWLITPVVAALRANQTNWLHNIIGGHVGTWNGISYIVYLLCSLIGLAIAIQLLRLANPQR